MVVYQNGQIHEASRLLHGQNAEGTRPKNASSKGEAAGTSKKILALKSRNFDFFWYISALLKYIILK